MQKEKSPKWVAELSRPRNVVFGTETLQKMSPPVFRIDSQTPAGILRRRRKEKTELTLG